MTNRSERDGAAAKTSRWRMIVCVLATIVCGLLAVPLLTFATSLASGPARFWAAAGILIAAVLPIACLTTYLVERQQRKTDEHVSSLTSELTHAITRQQFESRLANALDMAEGEPEVLDVIERSFHDLLPNAPVELLLADNSHAHLFRMASVEPDGGAPGCSVDSPDRCPAARRAQVQNFADSHALDACPKLRHRVPEPISALCVPVSIMGRTVGVIHATGRAGEVTSDEQIQDVATLAKLAGARVGLLRVMAETQLQASTDSLTGLLNRRSFSEKVASVPLQLYPIAVAMVDLDHFKTLNDTYGHETGDRALRLFARVLRDSLRSNDLLSRYGGEEFALAFPGCSTADAAIALEGVRTRLDAAVTVGGLPTFTASFGITNAEPGEDFETALRRADDALMLAKQRGRDQVVLHDTALHETPVSDDDAPPSVRTQLMASEGTVTGS
jgi:diguanylate cyclase (GGDEF)-like protein